MHKMIANAVAFEHPMQKIYTVLPPPIEEMDEATHSVKYYALNVTPTLYIHTLRAYQQISAGGTL